MKKLSLLFMISLWAFAFMAEAQQSSYYEMRTHHSPEGKRTDMIKRFQDHTLKLFAKNGIENVAYFIPTDEKNNTLTFILAYPDQESRDVLWNKFVSDPEWQKAQKASEANGPLVSKVDQVFMTDALELTAEISKLSPQESKIFELRTYHCFPGKLEAINDRFRDHTRELFEKHGMLNVIYWYTVEKDGAQPKLVYLLAHKDEATAKASFTAFGSDPEWIKVRDASEENGKIVEKVVSVYLKALPFSPIR